MRRTFGLLAAVACAMPALAQPCTPVWNNTIGTPGAADGYVGALTIYQGDLITSGSYTQMAGVSGSQYLTRYNRATNSWSSFGTGLGNGISNAFGTSFAEFNGDLIVGGFYSNATGLPDTKSISRWDGSAFHSMGTGWGPDTVNAVWSLLVTDAIGGTNKLYVGGGFDTIAGQPAGCIASWDGTSFTPLAPTMTLVGINPLVTAMTVFDDGQGGGPQLYIAGRFSAVGSTSANMIARWNGTSWSAVGTNLVPRNATSEVDCLLVHDDGTGPALYAGGSNLRLGTDTTNRAVVKWNGTTWSAVGQALGGRTWSMVEFDGDGAGPAAPQIYAGGTQAAAGYIYKLDAGSWVPVVGAASASCFKLLVDNGTLYAGGSFTTVNGVASSRIISRACPVIRTCDGLDFNRDGNIEPLDVDAYFSVLGEGPCVGDIGNGCNDLDFNNDGNIEPGDVDAYFSVLGVGPCI